MVTLSHARFLQRTTARVRRQGDADTVEAGPLGSTSASAIQKRFNEPHNPTSFPPTRKRLLIHTWYDGDANFSPSASAELLQTVVQASSRTILSSSATEVAGSPVVFTATVSPGPGIATGTVTFEEVARATGQ